jgi:hypothetical protein
MQLIETDDIDVYYITEDIDMPSVISFCKQYKELAIDTETKIDLSKLSPSALDPHSANISLVQINSIDNKIPYILDFLSLSKEAKELFNKEVLMDKDIRKLIHYACLPRETEVLTPKGWQNITEICAGDVVMGYKDGNQIWTKVNKFIDAGIQQLYTIANNRRTIIATEHHRHLCLKKGRKGIKELYITTKDIENTFNKNQTSLLHSAPACMTKDLFSKEEMALLAWIWGDGCIQKTKNKNGKYYYQCTITQSSKNYDYCSIIEGLLFSEGLRVSKYKLPSHPYIYRYFVPIKYIKGLYNRLNLELDSKDYSLFILNSSIKSIESFVEHFYYAEGTKSRKLYFGQSFLKNKEKSDCIALAGHLLGFTPYQGKDTVDFNIPSTTFRRLKVRPTIEANTYCLNTETSNFVIRQNNFISITGNSFDLKQFYSEFKTWPVNVWCTNVLMKSLSVCTGMKAGLFRGHSLKDMARDIFDINLDKTDATSEWGQRPLFNNQLSYAGLDVGAPKDSKYCSLLLEGYHIFKSQLDLLKQQMAYEIDQEAVLISAKMEYSGLEVNTDLLNKMLEYAKEQTDIHRNYLVEELGFTVYQDIDINEEGEWELMYIIPDKIKTLLNNNRALVSYINKHLLENGKQALSTLQAEEVKFYLDALEVELAEEKDNVINIDHDLIESNFSSITLIKNLLKYKKFSKFSTECQKYLNIINPNTGNIHAGFSSVGTASGRMSSSGAVNLQQVSNVQAIININKDQF